MFQGDIDPEIADLVGIEDEPQKNDIPDFGTLFGEEGEGVESEGLEEVDLTRTSFDPVGKIEEEPKPYFTDKQFYQKALAGEGEPAKRLHAILSQFLTAQDPQERSMHRQKIIPAYWALLASYAAKLHSPLPLPKLVTMRFGALLPTVITREQRDMLSRVIGENGTGEPIHYIDEWLAAVAFGRVNSSAQDETKNSRRNEQQKVNSALEKLRGRYQADLNLLKTRLMEMEALEAVIKDQADALTRHDLLYQFDNMKAPLNPVQRQAISEINESLRKLGNVDREVSRQYSELESVRKQLDDLAEKSPDGGQVLVDNKVVVEELNTIRQMAKLCVGRQGNHFPILMKQYFRPNIREIATRENVINVLSEVERFDPGLFLRTFKQQTNRIVPYVVLVPCFGDRGICWEPFERFNRSTSRGRLAIPMYPKELRSAIIAAAADLRWQVAKEKAQHYWMEEGLTGWYYQWFTEKRSKGDVREAFISDYILWITKETEGTQKLDREVRSIFWRYLPFPQDIKDALKNRGFVYAELCKKDMNRSLSDGY